MSNNEVRKDYLLNRWVVIAEDRKKRPTDFVTKKVAEQNGVCPFCLGNEHMTPPAELVYLPVKGEQPRKEADQKDFCHKDWLVRVIPNRYPAFSPSTKKEETENKDGFDGMGAVGHHEVIIESPCHNEQMGVAQVSQIVHVVNVYLDRLAVFSKKPYVKHVAIFRNHGQEAGASQSHPHSQLIATPIVPTILEEELKTSKQHWTKSSECLFCKILEKEQKSSRFIWENSSFVAFAPWASVNPFEFWVFPKRHSSSMQNMKTAEVEDLAETMRVCLGSLRSLLNDPPYNFGFHTLIDEETKDCYHWHWEVYPKLAIWGGFEKSTGMFINVISPEDAAAELRKAVQAEKEKL